MAARRWSTLKPSPTVFVGRSDALRALAGAVQRARLVTVLGPPGTGKTRLAKEFALSTLGAPWSPLGAASFEGGVFFCDLSDATAADDVLFRLAHTLGVDLGSAPNAALARLGAALEGSAPALVILDNFEQLVRSSAEVVGALVAANDRTSWLVTSRERLALPAEALFDLGPLGLPKEGRRDGEAIELFLERARAASRDFDPQGDELGDVASLVARLDGLPLAIELAAARTRVLRPREIIERLGDRFAILTRDTATLGRGSATLWETIDASWALLSPEEQRALGLLSVFRGGFDVRAAEHVIGAPPAPRRGSSGRASTLDLLQSLRDKSLLLVPDTEGGPPHPTRRFSLLASIREFAWERVDPAERAAGELRHADHYVSIGESLGAGAALALEHENLMAVHRRFSSGANADARPDYPLRAALIVCQGASAFPYAFCLGLLDDALAAIDARHPTSAPLEGDLASRVVSALEVRGNLRRFVGRIDESVEDFERMRAIADRVGARTAVAAALSGLGNAATVGARWSEARALFEQALAIHGVEGIGARRVERSRCSPRRASTRTHRTLRARCSCARSP
ncbi:MAG: tetratricopeptide repeat protein [Polyangiaceae bacterium]